MMDSALPFAIAIGAAVACCVFLVGRYYLTNTNETVEPSISFRPAPVATAPKPKDVNEEKITERTSQSTPSTKMSWQKMAVYVAGGIVAVLALMTAAGWNIDDSPRAKLERIRNECDRNYGKGTPQAFDCFTTLITRFAIEQRQNKLDRTYQNAK
jgi:hypothetical protein